jgi:pimeloyl-ACP methyl ester carboxylesterase
MPILPISDIHLHYEEYGSGQPLVLVHGFSGAGAVWNDFLPAFSARYRVIAPDLRGHGHSTGSLETIHHRHFAEDLLALLDALHIEKAHFVGHSSGGMCLLFIGTQHPERALSLSLVSATYTFDAHARPYMLQVADEAEKDPAAIAMSRQLYGEIHGEDCWKMQWAAFRNFTKDPLELPFQPADLAGIPLPVFVLHGDRDEFFPVYIPVTMYSALPRAELCILPNTGHGLPSEQPDLFSTLILRFLERVADG